MNHLDLDTLERLVALATRIARVIATSVTAAAIATSALLIIAHAGLYLERITAQ